MGSNRHMNIFHHYSQAGALPVENNISRGLAILMQEYPAMLLLFIEKLREKEPGLSIHMPMDSYEVDFQRKTDDFGEAEQVIGVALTADELTEDYEAGGVQVQKGYTPITDISINYDDTLIFIEVKRNDTDCRKQLEEQLDRYKKTLEQYDRGTAAGVSCNLISLTWTDIICLLKRYIGLGGGRTERLVTDYYEDLVYHYPAWSPVETLDKLNAGETDRIGQRTRAIKEQYMKVYGASDGQLMYGRGAIPIDFDYASECNLYLQSDFYGEDGLRRECITIGIWPSDTCSQYWKLKGKTKDFSFARSRFCKLPIPGYGDINVRIWPYIKLCHFNKGIAWLYMDEAARDNKPADWVRLADSITGRWKREDWPAYRAQVAASGLFSPQKLQEFDAQFKEKFLDSERSYLTASVGFEVFAYLPYPEAQRLEAGKVKDMDMAKVICFVLGELKGIIES